MPPGDAPRADPAPPGTDDPDDAAATMRLHAERITVSKRTHRTRVRVARLTRARDEVVEEDLTHEEVVVRRVPIGRQVEAVPDVRQEGEVTILSIVEEVLVVERRLVLKEEVHIRRVRTTRRHVETVQLREQVAEVTRDVIEE